MTKKLILSILALSLSFQVASQCHPKNNEAIVIGCSYKCSFIYRFRLLIAAMTLGYPLKIVDMREFESMPSAMSHVDGILIPGGADIDPEFYLNSVTPELRAYTKENLKLVEFTREGKYRDAYEHDLVKKYSTEESFEQMPLLGICRGMQMMSVAQGVPLYLDIKTELGIRNRRNVFDSIFVDNNKSDSLMSSMFDGKISGFKYHHQGLRMPYYLDNEAKYPQLKVTATSHGRKIAEAVEYLHRPALGIQYHPEKSFSASALPVFRWLFTKACEYKNSHKDQ